MADYAQRTAWNVRDSDATLVLTADAPRGGTALTLAEAVGRKKPSLHLRLGDKRALEKTLVWIEANAIRTLNVAGPRESEVPGIYARTRILLDELFGRLVIAAPARRPP